MKISYFPEDLHCALFNIANGYKNAFEKCGHEVRFYNPQQSALDQLNLYNPDLFIGTTYGLTRAICKYITTHPNMKVILRASDWGDYTDSIDLKRYEILVANNEEKTLLHTLKELTGKPDFIYNHYHDNYIHKTHKHWEENRQKVVSLLLAADITQYTNGQYNKEVASDICFIGSYHPYKARNLDRYIIPLCYPVGRYNVKIFSTWHWPVSQYCGSIPTHINKHVLKSAKICLNISEPHSTDLGYDIIERPFYLLSNKCFCLSDYVQSMQEDVFDNGEIPSCKTPEEFFDAINFYINNEGEKQRCINKGYQRIIGEHTYFHRVMKIFQELNLPEDANNVQKRYNKYVEDNQL
jgi:spore maturation protein CgeB